MWYIYLIIGMGLFFSSMALSKIGPVDSHDKLAACNNAPRSSAQDDDRGINPGNVLAHLSGTVGEGTERPKKRKPRRSQRGGQSGSAR